MLKRISSLIMLILFSIISFSQENIENMNVNTEISLGSSVITNKNFSAINSFFTPNFKIRMNPQLVFHSGFINSYSIYSDNHTNYTEFRNFVYTQANYQINEKLILTGDIIYGTNFIPDNSKKGNFHYKSYSFGAIYKVNENLHFQINIRQSDNNYNENLYYNPLID